MLVILGMPANVSYVKKLVSAFSQTLLTSLAPFRTQMESVGMDVLEYSHEDDQNMQVIIGIKITFSNPQVYEKFIGRKRKLS